MLFEQGVQAQKSGKPAEAEAIYRRILATDARNFDALHMLGIVCSEQGRPDEAERAFREAEAVDRAFPPFFHNFGLHYVRQKQFENAVAQFDTAIKLHPNYPPVLSDRGSALAEIGRLQEALDSHNKAVALAPNVPTMMEAGIANYEAGNWYGLLMPAATPAAIVNLVNAKTLEALKRSDTRAALAKSEIDPIGTSPQEFAKFVASETAKYAALIKQVGIKPE